MLPANLQELRLEKGMLAALRGLVHKMKLEPTLEL
jgi:hypothetical protein